MDITPEVGLLRALRQQRLKWIDLLGELIDNSLDAGATYVRIHLGPRKQVQVEDDGSGCKNIAAMLTLGGRQDHATTRLGRYGIGLKDAALYLWGETTIDTVHKGVRRAITVDWSKVDGVERRWEIPDPTEEKTFDLSGTKITFSRIEKNIPNPKPLVEELGFTFTPAILANKQIAVVTKSKDLCSAYKLPPLTDVVEAEFKVDGRGVILRAGIVADGHENKRSGFAYQHGHRVIDVTAMGSGGLSVSRVAGTVELDRGWALSKNKNSITELEDELAAAVYSRCEAMLRKADIQSKSLESSALSSAISDRMTAAIQQLAQYQKREKRAKPDESIAGTIKPKATGRKRKNAAKVHDIDGAVQRAARSGIKLDWSFNIDFMGKADLAGNRVILNASLPLLARLRREENADALAIVAFGLYVDEARAAMNPQKYLPTIDNGDFIESWSKVLAQMPGSESTDERGIA